MDASSNFTSRSIITGVTEVELWFQLVFCYVFLGSVAAFFNIVLLIGIYRDKMLRTRFFIIVSATIFCRCLICYQFMIVGIYRILRTLEQVSAFQPKIICILSSTLMYVTETLELALLTVLAIDRALAILAPGYYRISTSKGAFRICLTVYIGVLPIKIIPLTLLSGDLSEMVACININSAPGFAYSVYSQSLDIILCAVILILYVSLAIRLRMKISHSSAPAAVVEEASFDRTPRSSIVEADIRRITKLMPTFRNLVLVHSCFTFMSKLLLFLSSQVQEESRRLVLYAGITLIFDQVINVIVLISSNEDIRRACWPWARI